MVVTAAGAGTRAECAVDVAGVGFVVVVALTDSVDPVSTAAAAAGVSLTVADDALRELTFPPDDVTELWRAEWAVDFLGAVESLVLDDVEPSELAEVALPDPEAPVSAYATAVPLARAAPTPRVTAPAPSQAYGRRRGRRARCAPCPLPLCLMVPPVLRPHRPT
ncbi:hypothetical protein BST42_19340 [Mycolicibacterium rhodesiae]|uniref:Uncharacterized protein n=1 Tax=Mycolicibacterium rhodesiae TaxID=36814 RepID=A0A1X0IS61_MYCRH|nr:hypothetical protein BST42_19340 [Mycolicibacterium rhodesiae]